MIPISITKWHVTKTGHCYLARCYKSIIHTVIDLHAEQECFARIVPRASAASLHQNHHSIIIIIIIIISDKDNQAALKSTYLCKAVKDQLFGSSVRYAAMHNNH